MAMEEYAPLHLGSASVRTRALIVAANKRLDARRLNAYLVSVPPKIMADPEARMTLNAAALNAVYKAAWALGARKDTIDKMRVSGVVPIGVQRLIRNPGLRERTDRGREQIERGRRRMGRMAKQRKVRAAAAAAEKREQGTSSRTKAVNAFLAKVGTRENPPGSNGGGIITVMEAFYGFGRVPWCGISAGYHAEKFGGIDLRSDVAGVLAITNHAKNGRNPYGKFQSDPRGAHPGAFVIIGGPGTHVGMLVEALKDGSAKTVEGNTSFGSSGSQSNGGCIAARVRSPREIFGVATMNYPGG